MAIYGLFMKSRIVTIAVVTALVISIVIMLLPTPAGMDTRTWHAAALVILVITLWATAAIPEHLTSLVFFLLAMVFAIAPAGVVFSGFASGTVWLVLGGLVMADAVNKTGLGARFARFILGRFRPSYPALLGAIALVAAVLTFVMPATLARILLLLPIVRALAERMGLEPGSPGHNGAILVTVLTSYHVGTGVLPANAPNMVLSGSAEALYKVSLVYTEFFLIQFPILAFLRTILTLGLVLMLFPSRTSKDLSDVEAHKPMSGEECRLAVILLSALVLWITDFIHHINPGWVALGAGVACLLPRIGVSKTPGELPKLDFVMYLAGVIGMGAIMVQTGLNDMVGHAFTRALALESGRDGINFYLLSVLGTLVGLIVTNVAQPAILVPLAESFAHAAGWPLKTALMTIAVGFGTMILPYQVPPVLVGLRAGGIDMKTSLRLILPVAGITIFVLVPLDYFWWRLLGLFG
jgi:anion transporter